MYKHELVIPENQPKMLLYAWLRRALPLLPSYALREAFEKRDVKMDGVRVKMDGVTQGGAAVAVYSGVSADIPVVYEDENLLILNKPAGLSADTDAHGGMTALSWAKLRSCGAYTPRLCHRIDNPTSGILALAKNGAAEEEMLRMFREHTCEKTYICLVRGEPSPSEATREAYLIKDAKRAAVRILPSAIPGAKAIATHYTVLKPGRVSRLSVSPKTGRTHQIRAHMAYLSYPLLGDDKYGDRAFNREMGVSRLMLCASAITLRVGGTLSYLNERTFTVDPLF